MTKFWNGLGDLIHSFFGPIEALGANGFNKLLIVIGFVAFFYWLSRMAKYEKDEKKFS